MNETEIESMVVRLIGDASSYKKMMKDAEGATKDATKVVRENSNHIDGFGDQLSRFGELAVAGLQLYSLKRFLGSSIQAWEEQEAALIKLDAMLESNGRNVVEMTAFYSDFATEMQGVTTMADEVTIGILAQAESYGLTGAAATEATKAAVGFAAVNGGSAAQYLRFTAAMVQGDTEKMKMMARMIPQLRGIKDETLLMAKAQQLAATGFKTAEEQAKTYDGQLQQLNNSWGEILEDVGRVTTEFLTPFVTKTKEAVEWMQKFDEQTKTVVISILLLVAGLASIGPAFAAIDATMVPLFYMIISGFGTIASMGAILLSPFLLLKGLLVGVMVLFSPITLMLAGVALVAVGMLRRLGGGRSILASFSEWAMAKWQQIKAFAITAWDYIQDRAAAFYNWIVPIADAAAALAVTSWGVIKTAAGITWDFITMAAGVAGEYISSVWTWITGDTVVSWETIQAVAQRALLTIEFYLLNFKRVNYLMWLGIKIDAGATWDFIRDGFIGMVATAGASANVISNMFVRAWRVVRGGPSAGHAGYFAALAADFEQDFRLLADAMGAGTKSVSAETIREYATMRGLVGQELEAFIAERLAQFAALNSTVTNNPRANPVRPILDTAKEITKEIKKWDSALVGSAEDVRRLATYYAMLNSTRPASASSSSGGARNTVPSLTASPTAVAPASAPAAAGGPAPSPPELSIMVQLLRAVVAQATIIATRPQVTVVGVSLS